MEQPLGKGNVGGGTSQLALYSQLGNAVAEQFSWLGLRGAYCGRLTLDGGGDSGRASATTKPCFGTISVLYMRLLGTLLLDFRSRQALHDSLSAPGCKAKYLSSWSLVISN